MSGRRKKAEPNRKPTIYDIAAIATASPSTVSAVLNGTWRSRRIRESTATRIISLANEHGYSTNMQARGLRRAKSGMVGMIVPLHESRFFASISQSFEANARERGLCPVVASTLRDPNEEIRVVQSLLAYAVDYLFIAGATNPDSLGDACNAAGVPHVFIDLPGRNGPSVVTDNYAGASALTRHLLGEMGKDGADPADRLYFFGGIPSDYATGRRAEAFRDVHRDLGLKFDEKQIVSSDYSPRSNAERFEALCNRLGMLPRGILINSLPAFEGTLQFLVQQSPASLARTVFGCFDYDLIAAGLQFPVHFMRQDTDALVAAAYELFDAGITEDRLVMVKPELLKPRTILYGKHADLG